ncbi:MAG: hypothetical protein Q8920_08875 [Bacillota bacterium]|nr:hypothetical protein [Bacillota bacterium]
MHRFENAQKVGLRDIETRKLIAVYPHEVKGTDSEIEDKVKFWYYQQGCGAEEELRSSVVDVLTDNEVKSLNS